jgi:hypothetical protein
MERNDSGIRIQVAGAGPDDGAGVSSLAAPIFVLPCNAKAVVHVLDAGQALNEILGATFLVARVDRTRKCHLAVFDPDFNIGRIYSIILGQTFARVFTNPFVRAAIAERPAATERSVRGASGLIRAMRERPSGSPLAVGSERVLSGRVTGG